MIRTEPLKRIMKDVSILGSDKFAGRLSGTAGALAAAKYLAESLQIIGFSPAGADGYFASVDVPAARLTGPARLIIGGDELQHRIDFAATAIHKQMVIGAFKLLSSSMEKSKKRTYLQNANKRGARLCG